MDMSSTPLACPFNGVRIRRSSPYGRMVICKNLDKQEPTHLHMRRRRRVNRRTSPCCAFDRCQHKENTFFCVPHPADDNVEQRACTCLIDARLRRGRGRLKRRNSAPQPVGRRFPPMGGGTAPTTALEASTGSPRARPKLLSRSPTNQKGTQRGRAKLARPI